MRRLALLTALLALALPVATADAGVRHWLKGRGFGHGIGMSQYGAYGYALEGTGHRQILAHYYKGTRLSTAPSRPVRVLLQPVDPYIRVRGATSVNGQELSPRTTYVARRSSGGVRVSTSSGKRVARSGGVVTFRSADPIKLLGPALNFVTNGRYRGAIEVRPDGGGVTAINELDLDSYVRGVVAGEMPSSWPLEALKAQAVAARTYALATRKTSGAFDQYPDTRSQVYRGVTGESVRSDAAVRATAGRTLTYSGQPAVTYYFSTSGGHTENVEYSFVGSLSKPWLVGVPDPYDFHSPFHTWRVPFSGAALDRALRAPGSFERLQVVDRGVSPRVVRARVIGTRGSTTVTGPTVRAQLGLRDTWFTHVRVASSSRRSPSARLSVAGPWALARTISGEFWPAPRGGRLLLERRMNGRWRTVGRVRTSARGRYRAAVGRRGVYRVRSGALYGPAVRLR